jgi:hypothetical protein
MGVRLPQAHDTGGHTLRVRGGTTRTNSTTGPAVAPPAATMVHGAVAHPTSIACLQSGVAILQTAELFPELFPTGSARHTKVMWPTAAVISLRCQVGSQLGLAFAVPIHPASAYTALNTHASAADGSAVHIVPGGTAVCRQHSTGNPHAAAAEAAAAVPLPHGASPLPCKECGLHILTYPLSHPTLSLPGSRAAR